MQCTTCKSELPPKAKFCPECGTPVPTETSMTVQQDVGTIKGTVVGQSLGSAELPPDLKSTTTQNVESVESGGSGRHCCRQRSSARWSTPVWQHVQRWKYNW
jgi:hypothetical protein